MKLRFNTNYFYSFLIVLIIEVMIALFIKGNLIRGFVGDVLVVVLIYCFIKSFVRYEIRFLPLYIFIFATLIEIGQYFNFVALLGLENNRVASIILGATFDVVDIFAYFSGCFVIYVFEKLGGKYE